MIVTEELRVSAWVPLDEVAGLERPEVVDVGLELHRVRPGNGRVA
ncbi:hypothetical protein ACIBQ1_33355 [Nonomuraea sp. NPDC050153]